MRLRFPAGTPNIQRRRLSGRFPACYGSPLPSKIGPQCVALTAGAWTIALLMSVSSKPCQNHLQRSGIKLLAARHWCRGGSSVHRESACTSVGTSGCPLRGLYIHTDYNQRLRIPQVLYVWLPVRVLLSLGGNKRLTLSLLASNAVPQWYLCATLKALLTASSILQGGEGKLGERAKESY